MRIEDIDAPRCSAAHASRIMHSLEALGLTWDDTASFQSRRLAYYQQVFDELKAQDLIFPCTCTRKQLQSQRTSAGELRYPGTCRMATIDARAKPSWRFRVNPQDIEFNDRLLGWQRQCPAQQCGDFVIRRRDQLFAYQLVVVVDDAAQGVTQIVRGADILPSTGRQIMLQQHLGYTTPTYLHLPVLTDAQGRKLSKSSGASEIPWQQHPSACLNAALRALGQPAQTGPVEPLLSAAIDAWQPERIPKFSTSRSNRGMPQSSDLAN